MRFLILDDDQTRQDTFAVLYGRHDRVHVYSAPQAIDALAGDKFDVVFLDHDLGDGHGDGLQVVDKLVTLAAEKRPDRVIVHSWNGPRALMMTEILRREGFSAVYKPFQA